MVAENYTHDVIIVCEDSYGLDVYSIVEAINAAVPAHLPPRYRVLGFLNDNYDSLSRFKLPAPFLGSVYNWNCAIDASYILAIRNPAHKRAAVELLKGRGAVFETIMAPWVKRPSVFEHGEGCIIANYIFKYNSRFGDFVTMDTCMCESVEIGDYSTICPFVNITTASIGKNVFIGTHAAIIPEKIIEDDVTIYPGSIVMSNVRAGMTVAGIPAGKNLKKWRG